MEHVKPGTGGLQQRIAAFRAARSRDVNRGVSSAEGMHDEDLAELDGRPGTPMALSCAARRPPLSGRGNTHPAESWATMIPRPLPACLWQAQRGRGLSAAYLHLSSARLRFLPADGRRLAARHTVWGCGTASTPLWPGASGALQGPGDLLRILEEGQFLYHGCPYAMLALPPGRKARMHNCPYLAGA